MRKAIFLDRDGVINKHIENLIRPEQFHMHDFVPEAIKRINDSGYLAILITNQPIISKNFCSFDDMDKIHEKMKNDLKRSGAYLNAIYICPHHPEKGHEGENPSLKYNCDCRKPKPGLLLRAAKEHDIELSKSWMIGDSKVDIYAGNAAGCKTVLISDYQNTRGFEHEPQLISINLKEAIKDIFS